MKRYATILLLLISAAKTYAQQPLTFFKANDSRFQYVGRIDFTQPERPRFWAAGVYITARFKGTTCTLLVNDEVMYGTVHNYIEVVIDGVPARLQTTGKTNEIVIAKDLPDTAHTVVICKDTESGLGYLDFLGLKCSELLNPPVQPTRRIEYYGDSITTGTGADESAVPCGKGQWHDQHNAYMSYGARTSRALNAQWQLTAVAGIGMVHSCCNMDVVFPQVYDKVYLRNDSLQWDFKRYPADVVTICLGQNDGTQDYEKFGSAYIKLITAVRSKYPNASIVCLTSPMADAHLTEVLKKYLTRIVRMVNMRGDKKVSKFFFSRSFNSGCDGHPDINEHEMIANQLIAYIKTLKGW
ncbi:acetyl xylan esterase [Inquilinus sp. KBS0705]|nr:acetyl xylan esterase [Inquilinus sp. KBS0705]